MTRSVVVGAAHVEPVLVSIRVDATPERAFEVFSREIGRWWLATHSILPSGSAQAEVLIEARAGGRWYERGADGSECDWGRVLEWDPPRRLLLAWQLDAQWRFDPALVTEVDVRFEAEPGGQGTRVTLEHRALERFGTDAHGARAALQSKGGWPGLLERYRQRVDG